MYIVVDKTRKINIFGSSGVVIELNCLWNCSKATQQPEFRCDMATNCACYLLHL